MLSSDERALARRIIVQVPSCHVFFKAITLKRRDKLGDEKEGFSSSNERLFAADRVFCLSEKGFAKVECAARYAARSRFVATGFLREEGLRSGETTSFLRKGRLPLRLCSKVVALGQDPTRTRRQTSRLILSPRYQRRQNWPFFSSTKLVRSATSRCSDSFDAFNGRLELTPLLSLPPRAAFSYLQ